MGHQLFAVSIVVAIVRVIAGVIIACGLALPSSAASQPSGLEKSVLVLGDSISAAYGIDKGEGWVALLERRLAYQCPGVGVHNASVSGETTAGGLQRLTTLLQQYKPQLLILELGGNDGLRGLMPAQMGANLKAMIELAGKAKVQVVMLGILMPPNLGQAYVQLFERAITDAAEQGQVPFLDFFLRGVAGNGALMQVDGLHPTAAAQSQLLDNAWLVLAEPLTALCGAELEPVSPRSDRRTSISTSHLSSE